MDPLSQRKTSQTQTVTRDSISWKILDKDGSGTDWLENVDIESLALKHAIDGELLRLLLRRLSGILHPELRLAQPDLTIARRKKGQKELARANDLIRSAEGKLLAASKILRDLGFKSDFSHVGMPIPERVMSGSLRSLPKP